MLLAPIGIRGLNVVSHGGECCGIHTIHGFPTFNNSWQSNEDKAAATTERKVHWIREAIDEVLEEYRPDDYCFNPDCKCGGPCEIWPKDEWSTCIEVVLITEQVEEWGEALGIVGFKETYSFLNSNSGNVCHIFHFTTNVGT